MKKFLIILTVMIMGVTMAQARDIISRNASDLPAAAQTMLKKYFPKKTINHIKIDKKIVGSDEYDVVLNDGTEIDFDGDDWKEIDCGTKGIPAGILPASVYNYVSKNYKGAKIIAVEKSRNKYEIELSNGLDLEFDRSGKFLRIDD
ncbi:MAG: PepSY-like domain-containing protein [Prevotella sp.]|nr:PepSY-like domain-containing protein [Bacteroides sp.]MCM1367119.1 PepSY-like domain-containing protein [Prevotella sp.]MCM1437350.1 PepSY-like domain-containing protein [Prevotella sp.]